MNYAYIAKRNDDTFEINQNGLPYHLLADEPLYTEITVEHAELIPGFAHVRKADGSGYDTLEDHRNTAGWVNGQPHTITDFGPLPEGWSDTPPPPSLDAARSAKLTEIMRGYSAAFAPIEELYPLQEREGWPLQETEAHALQANPAAETPVLSMLVHLRARGESVTELAAKVLENAVRWRAVYAALTGQQQRMFGEVSGLVNVADIIAYPVIYQLPQQ